MNCPAFPGKMLEETCNLYAQKGATNLDARDAVPWSKKPMKKRPRSNGDRRAAESIPLLGVTHQKVNLNDRAQIGS
jgi:hypothetical protein